MQRKSNFYLLGAGVQTCAVTMEIRMVVPKQNLKTIIKLGMVTHAHNPSTEEAGTRGSPQVLGQTGQRTMIYMHANVIIKLTTSYAIENNSYGDGERAQQSRALANLPQDLHSIFSTHMTSNDCENSKSNALFGLHRH